MIDVIERLQCAETTPLDADGKTKLWQTLQDARAEIERLRLTDAEREAVERAAAWLFSQAKNRADIHSCDLLLQDAATLRGLLERTGGDQ